jgi:3-phosphoshikimate 1-carboxyvinyltransferase
MDRVVEPLRAMGASIEGRDGGRFPPLVVRGGGLHGIDYTLPVASAQVKAAILLAGLAADGETIVREPVPTRAHTEELLALAGADVEVGEGWVRVRASRVKPLDLDVPGDPSQAAFWVVGACITPGSDLTVENVYRGPARTGFVDVLRRMGADVEMTADGDIRARASSLRGADVGGDEVAGLVDEVPVLAVAAATAEGTTVFRDAAELRVKETDRIATVASELSALGGRVEPRPDGLVVHGGGLRAGHVRSHGDHRVAMAMAVAALAVEGETTIDGWEAVATSYPGFEGDLRACAS